MKKKTFKSDLDSKSDILFTETDPRIRIRIKIKRIRDTGRNENIFFESAIKNSSVADPFHFDIYGSGSGSSDPFREITDPDPAPNPT